MNYIWRGICKPCYDIIDEKQLTDLIISQTLIQTQSMFEYDNLPDTIDSTALELLLQTNGIGVGIMHEGKPYILLGNYAGRLNYNYFPSQCIVSNPYLEIDNVYDIGKDCVPIRCDSLSRGLIDIISKWAVLIARSEITLNLKDIMSRTPYLITANSDTGRESAELFIKRLVEGKIAIIHDEKILNIDDLRVFPTSDTGRGITESLEYHRYLKGGLAHDLGLNANYNLKREYVSNGESGLNEDVLRPLVDDMLETRQADIKRFNAFAGTDIVVRLNSTWDYNNKMDDAILDNVESEDNSENGNVQGNNDREIETDTNTA